jgi:hypothetical protein
MSSGAVRLCQCPRCQQGPPHPDRGRHRQMNVFLRRLDEARRRWYAAPARPAHRPGWADHAPWAQRTGRCAAPAVAARRSGKRPGDPDRAGGAGGARDGRRPDGRAEVGAQRPAPAAPPPGRGRACGQPPDRRAAAEGAEVRAPRQRQAGRGPVGPPRPRRPVRPHRRPARGLPGGGAAGELGRHQAEGLVGNFTDAGRAWGRAAATTWRPIAARSTSGRRAIRPSSPSPRAPAGGWRWAGRPIRRPRACWSWPPAGAATAIGRGGGSSRCRSTCATGPGGPRRPATPRPAVRPDQPALGGPAAADLGDAAGLPAGHHDGDRAAGDAPTGLTVPPAAMRARALDPHAPCPTWNDTIRPRPATDRASLHQARKLFFAAP